ncbi:MAG: glutaredoxin family protein [Betaproteobacteria bacterium]|nr:glutaredoxin family protein [Betaproteobacteria bacterium]
MLAALETLRGEQGGEFDVSILDIDTDPLLVARYDEFVPVLTAGAGDSTLELCRYFLDVSAVRAYLAEFR